METEATISRPESRSGRYSQGGTTREQRCSESAMLGRQATDGMSGQTTMRATFFAEQSGKAGYREGSIHQLTSLRSVLMASPPRTGFADIRFKLTL